MSKRSKERFAASAASAPLAASADGGASTVVDDEASAREDDPLLAFDAEVHDDDPSEVQRVSVEDAKLFVVVEPVTCMTLTPGGGEARSCLTKDTELPRSSFKPDELTWLLERGFLVPVWAQEN